MSDYCTSYERLCVHCVYGIYIVVYIVVYTVLQTTRFLHTAHLVFCRRHTLCTRCTVCYISVRSWPRIQSVFDSS